MLIDTDPNQQMDKKEYKETLSVLEDRLSHLQQKVREAGLPVVIVFDGWGAAGKGTHISRLVNPLDPRYFDVRTTGKVTEEKQMRPFLWSFWTYLPPKGQIVIMDKSWHRLILPEAREFWKLSNMEVHGFYFDVNAFERQLSDDGYLIIKLFMHISKDEQARRFKALEKDPSSSWRVNSRDWEQNKNYEHIMRLFEKTLRMTSTETNPWHIIEANDRRYGTVKMMNIVINALENALEKHQAGHENPSVNVNPEANVKIPRTLQSVSPDEKIEHAEYREAIEFYQQRMRTLSNKMYAKRRSAAIIYEGWDAAGKGGNIKRLTSEMDPRCYAVVPIGPPRLYELSRPFLWRFMVKMPKDGHLTIFDRSWYGRVLVERVDELTPVHIWQRAYREINEFEQHLVGHGTVLLKFWLHIDKDEQLRRFESRQADPLKHHKITEDDWRNREKWDLYESAVDEMLMRTHTPHSPWIIVESNSKKYARIKVLQTVTDALEDALR
ncbi:MAG: polyphosphate:AMP phosphotransferase [Defluviitaleaceae bacterium]|nr:polyphosphate:AMP phosphotransferase [Defluviitaleaceae bacterium]